MPTIVEPTGDPRRIDVVSPIKAHITEIIADPIVTDLKVLKILIEEITGKTMSADTRSDPTRFIARTITIAVIVAIKKL